MALPEHVERLKSGRENWNRWIVEGTIAGVPRASVDLTNAKLTGADLVGFDLRVCNLEGADLRLARLMSANMGSARLSCADLRGADLSESRLNGVKLAWADLRAASLARAIIFGADLTGAKLNAANLTDTMLVGVMLNDASLGGAVLGGTTFGACDLSGCDLTDLTFNWPCVLDPATMGSSASVPESFPRGCGWPERLIEYWPSIVGAGLDLYSGFISYSRAEPDVWFARRLHDSLQARGIRVWRDEHELNPGDLIMHEIDRAIRVWDKTLLCCSKKSLNSWWVDREIEKAIAKERDIKKRHGEVVAVLVPLDLDGFVLEEWEHPYKTYVLERLAADFQGWEGDSAKFERALDGVVRAMTVGGAKPPPPEPKL